MSLKVLVTGGNRGLGLETARQLLARGASVILTARHLAEADEAAESLVSAASADRVLPRVLDVTDEASIDSLAASLTHQSLKLDALVNNAGASFDGFDAAVAKKTLATNFRGALNLTKRLRAQLAPHANVVMVSSQMGTLSSLGPKLRERFLAPDLDEDKLIALANQFISSVAAGNHAAQGWPTNAYRVSKVALNALVRVWADSFAAEGKHINAVCPGWVRTDMGGRGAPRSVEQGASGIVWAALIGSNGPNGGFFQDEKRIDW